MQDTLKYGFQVGMRQWRCAAIVYFLQLCLALTVGMQVYDVLQASIGNSLEINKLLENYDHTVVTDFLKVHGASITPLIGQLRWLLLMWLIFSVFMDAGLLYCSTSSGRLAARSFWLGGATWFFSFFKIALIFLLLALLWTAMIWIPMASFIEPSMQIFPSEKYTVWLVLALAVLWLTGLAVLFVWSVLSRLHRLQNESTILRSVKRGWNLFRKNKWRFMALLASFAILQIGLILTYLLFDAFVGMTSAFLIVMVFIVQQGFVFSRIQMRLMMYAAIGQAVKLPSKSTIEL